MGGHNLWSQESNMANGTILPVKIGSRGGPHPIRGRGSRDFAGEHADDSIDAAADGLQGNFILTRHQQGG